MEIDRQTGRLMALQTDEQTDIRRNKQIGGEANKYRDRKEVRWTYRQTDSKMNELISSSVILKVGSYGLIT